MKKKIQMTILGCVFGLAVAGAAVYFLGPASAPEASVPETSPEASPKASIKTPSEKPTDSGAVPAIPVKGTVTMLDLGATECIPCKMMAPILKELEKEYEGKAAIVFVDVWKDPTQARKYGVKAIPTQIFFNEDGKEVYRHTGFLDKKSIVKKLEQLGVASSPS